MNTDEKFCRDCHTPIGLHHTFCARCRQAHLDILLDARITAMTRPEAERFLPAIDRRLAAVRENGPDVAQIKEPVDA